MGRRIRVASSLAGMRETEGEREMEQLLTDIERLTNKPFRESETHEKGKNIFDHIVFELS